MQNIPVSPVPAQVMTVQLNGTQSGTPYNQNVRIRLYQLGTYGLFMDVYLSGALIVGGQICQDKNRIIRDAYLGFVGDLIVRDTQGSSDPDWSGLGTRYLLTYLTPDDLAVAS
jgi:hypothetical protein